MTVALFVTILTVGAAASSLLTQAVKKWYENQKKNYSSNVIALINAVVIGCGGTAVTYMLISIPWSVNNIICLLIMGVCVWIGSMIGYDKVIQLIKQLGGKSTDTNTAYGTGRCATSNTSAIGQGTMNTNGLFWGSTDQTSGVKVFGMENWWGNIWRRIAGWIIANGTQKVKITQGTHDGSTATDYNLDGTGYLTLSGATPAGTSSGYISAMKNDLPFGRIPVTAGGSSSTYEADGLWFNNGQVDYPLVGGAWNYPLLCGAFCAILNSAESNTSESFGAALSCKPLAV